MASDGQTSERDGGGRHKDWASWGRPWRKLYNSRSIRRVGLLFCGILTLLVLALFSFVFSTHDLCPG
jgi:hypothetical protein